MRTTGHAVADPLVSLIVTAHNHTGCLPRLLDSVVAQRFERLEVVLVDDCSDIPCDTVVEAYARRGLDLRLIRCPDRVFTRAARLVGVRAARADILAFADADDMLWGEGSLAQHAELLRTSGADAVHFRYVHVDGAMNICNFRPPHHWPFAPALEGEEIFRRFVDDRTPGYLWNKLYAKRLWLKILPIAEQSAVGRYMDDIYLSALLCFHMRRYVGSERCGYAHYFDRREDRSAGRAVGLYCIVRELAPYFRAEGCPEDALRRFIDVLKEKICLYAGRFCRGLASTDGFAVAEEELDRALRDVDRNLLLRALLLGNGMNARKLTQCARTVFGVYE